jgi:hypothetical protein
MGGEYTWFCFGTTSTELSSFVITVGYQFSAVYGIWNAPTEDIIDGIKENFYEEQERVSKIRLIPYENLVSRLQY